MNIITIPDINISHKNIDILLSQHNSNNCYIEISISDYHNQFLESNLLYLLEFKAFELKLNHRNVENIVLHIIMNLKEYSKNYIINKIVLEALTKDVFCYQIKSQYKTFRTCCYTNL